MKEQVLSAGDRAALQGLIPLAGALGAGTIFALFFGGRKRGSGIAVFELFAIVAVLVSVGTTAYLAIALLHNDEAISDRILTQTATPLIFAVFLLVLVSVLGRLQGSVERVASVLPLLLVAGAVAAWLASSAWSFQPGETAVMAALILGVGGLTALLAWGGERLDRRLERGLEQRRFVRLSVAGYRVVDRELRFALPKAGEAEGRPSLSYWLRKDGIYLDPISCKELRRLTRTRWDGLAEGKGGLPGGPVVLTRADVTSDLLSLMRRRSARFWVFEPGANEEIRIVEIEANDDGLFNVSELGLIDGG